MTQIQDDNAVEAALHLALEVSNTRWRLAFGDGVNRRHVAINAGALIGLYIAVGEAKERFHFPEEVRVLRIELL